MPNIPRWLLPWLIPVALVLGLVAVSVSTVLGWLFLALVVGVLVSMRVQDLRDHPPNPELRRRNFWDLR